MIDSAQPPGVLSPATRRPRRPWWVRIHRRLLAYIVIIYAVWFLGSCTFQERLIYPRHLAGPQLPESVVPSAVERVWITADDGSRVEGWVVPAQDASAAHPAPAVIFFHGNAELIDHNLNLMGRYHARGYTVLMPEFRGYGRSGGTPNQTNIVADASAFHDWLSRRPDVDTTRIVIHGRSIGTGVAAQLAALHEPAALILESPFTSLASFARRYLVPTFFLKSPYRTDEVIPRLTCPVLILAGRSDEIVPIEHGRTLGKLAKNGTMVELDGSHNSGLSEQEPYWQAVDAALARLAKP